MNNIKKNNKESTDIKKLSEKEEELTGGANRITKTTTRKISTYGKYAILGLTQGTVTSKTATSEPKKVTYTVNSTNNTVKFAKKGNFKGTVNASVTTKNKRTNVTTNNKYVVTFK